MILSRSTQVVERRRDALILSEVNYTPGRQTERREVHTPGQVVVETALAEEGLLALSLQIISPLQVVTITHTEEDYGNRVTDETTVESTPLADFLNAGGRVIVVMASMPVSAEQAAAAQPTFNSKPRFRVYPPAPEEDEFYGMYDEGDHGEPDEEEWFPMPRRTPDDCGGDCCRHKWN